MSDLLANLWMGFQVAGNPFNILFCLLGVLVGTLVGVLPGVGSVATIAMLLPITFGLPPVGALIMLAGIYYGAQYGGSTTSILVNIPGEATSGHHPRRSPDGQARPCRPGVGYRRDRIVLRRLRRNSAYCGPWGTIDQARAGVRAGRILLADGARPDLCGRSSQRFSAEGDRDDRVWLAVVDGRFRHRNRRLAHGLQYSGTGRRARLRH